MYFELWLKKKKIPESKIGKPVCAVRGWKSGWGLGFPVGVTRGAVVLFAEIVDKRKSENC